eukprot:TRINITY_DN44957_c0_g1_i1.p1 TRINITY_DN44957_c0_g1~~TRINITY_DN44957_c0_g1_i1.p1  ORF type:complete len:553 (-),score=117.20 TRINITY_DN44957_c0_g1_i1:679-2337(-)
MSFKGKVKSFNPNRGFGFISDKGGDTFFLEKYCVDGKQPKKGDIVFFDKVPDDVKSGKMEGRNVTGGTGESIIVRAEAPTVLVAEQQQEQNAKTTSSNGGCASTSTAPVALTVTASDPRESSPARADVTVNQDDTMYTLANSKKPACAGDFDSMHDAYQELGSEAYYKTHGEIYTNPHEPVIARALVAALDKWAPKLELPLRRVHDLACGSGEASAAFSKLSISAGCALDASDPYTFAAFEKRMGRPAYRWSFEDIAGGMLEDMQPYDLVIGSFSLHLLTKTWHHTTLSALARSCRMLIVLTPHKLPVIEPSTGWRMVDEVVQERIRARLYISDGARRLGQEDGVEHSDYTIVCSPPLAEEENVPDVDELDTKEMVDIIEQVSKMNNHELREALIKRGLSTAGQRSKWGDRLIMAVKEAKGHSSESPEDIPEAEKFEDEEDPEGEEESEYEGGSDEEDTTEKEESDPTESTGDEEDEAAAALAAKKAAIKAALAAKKPAHRSLQGKQTPAAAKPKQESKKKVGEEWTNFKADLAIAAAHVQGNFGQTKFIKP